MLSKIIFLCFALKLISGSISQQHHHIRNADEDVYCYSSSTRSSHKQFATKTAYEAIKGKVETDSTVEECKPVKIWLLSRHGSTHPSESTINELIELEHLRVSIAALKPETLCAGDKQLIEGWKWDENRTSHPDVLSNEGWKEIKTLAGDYSKIYGDLFDSNESVLFRHTTEQRNNESIYGFATALFDTKNFKDDTTDSDLLFKFYESCNKWKENKEKLNDTDSDVSKFERSEIFNDTIKEISDRLGFSEQLLSIKEIKNIWDMCRFDSAWDNDKFSPWCSAFTPDHIDVLEYHEDIELYHKTGQGAEINARLACKTVVDLIDHLVSNATTSPKAVVSVADATTIQLFLTALGAHKDTLRPSTDSMEKMGNRKWNSSESSPYASNLAVIKYDCLNDEHQVKFFLNQKPLVFDWCSDGVCGFKKFVEYYQPFKTANCTEYFCSEDSGSATIEQGMFAVAVSFILIYLY